MIHSLSGINPTSGWNSLLVEHLDVSQSGINPISGSDIAYWWRFTVRYGINPYSALVEHLNDLHSVLDKSHFRVTHSLLVEIHSEVWDKSILSIGRALEWFTHFGINPNSGWDIACWWSTQMIYTLFGINPNSQWDIGHWCSTQMIYTLFGINPNSGWDIACWWSTQMIYTLFGINPNSQWDIDCW